MPTRIASIGERSPSALFRKAVAGAFLLCMAICCIPGSSGAGDFRSWVIRLSVIDELEMQVEANLKRAERLRQAILKRAFEGKMVPQDPNDEPASALLERIRRTKLQETDVNSKRRKKAALAAGGRAQV